MEEIKYYYVVYVLGNYYIKFVVFRENIGREKENNIWWEKLYYMGVVKLGRRGGKW